MTVSEQSLLNIQVVFGVTPQQAKILAALSAGQPRLHRDLLREIEGPHGNTSLKTLRVQISSIRQRLAGRGANIVAIPTKGYVVTGFEKVADVMRGKLA